MNTDIATTQTREFPQWSTLLAHFLIYLTILTAAIGQPLLQMYGDNLTVFTTARFEGLGILGFMVLVLLAVPVIFSAVEALVWLAVPRLRFIVHYALVYFALVALVLVVTRSITVDTWEVHTIGAMIAASGLLWLFHRFEAIKTWARWMSPLALVVGISFVFAVRDVVWVPEVGAVDVAESSEPQDTSATPPEDVSVVWIVLDEAPLFPLLNKKGEINKERFPGFAQLAESSTWYRNVLSPSQRTTDAVPSMLSGLKPIVGADPVVARYPRNVFTLLNTRVGFDAREFTTALCPREICGTVYVSSTTGGEQSVETAVPQESLPKFNFTQFVKDAVVVLGHKVLPSGLRDNLPRIDESWGGFANGAGIVNENESLTDETTETAVPEDDVMESSFEADTQEETKAAFRADGPAALIPPFEEMVGRAKTSVSPTFYFQHVMLPHRPWKLTPDQRTYSGAVNPARVKDISVPDNSTDLNVLRHEYRALLMQYAAVDTMIGTLVTELQNSAAWDRTMIVVTSDHGLSMESGTTRRRVVDANEPGTLEDLYRVPLFIKYPDQKQSDINDCAAMTYDILPTVAGAKQLDAGWTFDGVDLARQCPDRTTRQVTWEKDTLTMTSDWGALLNRVALYDKYVSVEGGVDGIFGYGSYTSLLGRQVSGTESSSIASWSVNITDQFANVSDQRFATVPVQISGTVTLSQSIPGNAVGVVTLNGVVAGFIGELSGASAGAQVPYRAMLSTAQLTSGPHSVGLTIVLGSAKTPTYEAIVAPS